MNYNQMPIVKAMNQIVPDYISWCTPSIPDDIAQVRGVYKDDISVSFHTLGSFLSNTGIFKKAHEMAAKVYGARHTLFSVNGSTGSNFICLNALSYQTKGKTRILASRNIHKSVLYACEVFGVDIDFIPARYDSYWHMYLPPEVSDVRKALSASEYTYDAVLLTNPTYEGLTCRLKEIVDIVHDYDSKTWVYVDEAWGAHLHFTDKLPYSAMQGGADIAVQSTHKQGGALQQCGMIHVQGERVDMSLLRKSHQHLTTTSPSYHLLASLDAARWYMEHNGRRHLESMIDMANDFRRRIKSISGLSTFGKEYATEKGVDIDLTKIQMRTVECGFAGYEVADYLENMNIITEKSDPYTLLFITTFEIKRKDMLSTAAALAELPYEKEKILSNLKNKNRKNKSKNSLKGVWLEKKCDEDKAKYPLAVKKAMPFPQAVHRIVEGKTENVSLTKAAGRIAAENITIYPPGIPVTVTGEELTEEILTFLAHCRAGQSEILAEDPKLRTIKVVSHN